MAARAKAARQTAGKAGKAAAQARQNPYVQRFIEDPELRENVRAAFESARKAYKRMQNGKGPARALVEDKKLQKELRQTADSLQAGERAAPRQAAAPSHRAQAVDARDPRRHRGADPFRGRAQGRPRPDLRRGGGVRVHLEHRPARRRAELAAAVFASADRGRREAPSVVQGGRLRGAHGPLRRDPPPRPALRVRARGRARRAAARRRARPRASRSTSGFRPRARSRA